MNFQVTKPTTTRLQGLLWFSVCLITFFSMLPMDGLYQSTTFTIINASFHALIIYGHISFIYPRFYESSKWKYGFAVLVLLLLCGVGKGLLISFVYAAYFAKPAEQTSVAYMVTYYTLCGILIYLLSFVFRIALAYFRLKSEAEEILLQKTQAELNLLKSQVQPHFLFNTLNNIYYEAYLEAPRTAGLIERLADIMRYFVDESPKALVPVSTEIQFLENYIELEQIRIRHGVQVNFVKEFPTNKLIPPMLMMTLVENVFKHGIDRTRPAEPVDIALQQDGDYLVFRTSNHVYDASEADAGSGFGLHNLRRRLKLLYGEHFTFSAVRSGQTFTTHFKIPIS